jgi:hypothetical protein
MYGALVTSGFNRDGGFHIDASMAVETLASQRTVYQEKTGFSSMQRGVVRHLVAGGQFGQALVERPERGVWGQQGGCQ